MWIKLNKLLIDADVKDQKKKKLKCAVEYYWSRSTLFGCLLGALFLRHIIVGHNSQLTPTFAVCTVGIPTPQAPRSWLGAGDHLHSERTL